MFLTKKHIHRRAFLRGAGVTLALPLLDSMLPAQTPVAKTSAAPKTRFSGIFVPHGMAPGYWIPEGATLVPGVVGHCTDFIEHPDLVAERLVRYARLVGRENVLAGTDCGLGTRVGHPSICWAKFEAMAEGARRATKILWGRA